MMVKFVKEKINNILIKITFFYLIFRGMKKQNYPNQKNCKQKKSKIFSNFFIFSNFICAKASKSDKTKLKYLYFILFIFYLFNTANTSALFTTRKITKTTTTTTTTAKITKSSSIDFSYRKNKEKKIIVETGTRFEEKEEEEEKELNIINNKTFFNELLFKFKPTNQAVGPKSTDLNNEYYIEPKLEYQYFEYFLKTKRLPRLPIETDLEFDKNADGDLSQIYELLININKNSTLSDKAFDEIRAFLVKYPKYFNLFFNENMASTTNASVSSTNEWFNLSAHNRRIFNIIVVYLTCIICITGLIGNILSLKVFCSTKLPRTSSRIYLIALTVSDGIFLVTHFLDKTCKDIVDLWKIDFPLNITDQKQTMCRSFALLRNTCRAVSPWLIVAFTVERFLVVLFPHHSSIISKPLLAKRFIFVIITLSVLISLYAPILTGVSESPKKKLKNSKNIDQYTSSPLYYNYLKQAYFKTSCDVLENYRKIYLYLTFFYTFIVIIMPLVIVSVLNTILISRLYQSTDQWTRAKLELHEQELSYKEIRDKKMQVENFKVTWTLIIISASFIFLTLPYVINYFITNFYFIRHSVQLKSLFMTQKITELMYILNHSINFFLYIVTRNSFRRVLKEKLRCDCLNIKSYMIANVNNMAKNCHAQEQNQISSSIGPKSSLNNQLNENAQDSNKKKSLGEANPIDTNKNVIDPQTYENYWNNFNKNSIKKKSLKRSKSVEKSKPTKLALLKK